MLPFLVATLLALLIAGAFFRFQRRGDRRRVRQVLAAGAIFVLALAAYSAWISGGKLSRADAGLVGLSGLQMTEVAGSYRVTGIAANRSTTGVLTSLPLQLTVENCVADGQCRPLYAGSRELLVTILPGQSVPFTAVFIADPMPAGGERRWQLQAGNPKAHDP